MRSIILMLALVGLCLGLKGQTVYTDNCEDSLTCVIWDFPDSYASESASDHMSLTFHAEEGSKITGFQDIVNSTCWFCEGEEGVDWYHEDSLSDDGKTLKIDIHRISDSLSGSGMIAGIIIIVDDVVIRKGLPLIQNPGQDLISQVFVISKKPLKVRLVELGSGRQYQIISTPGKRSLPTDHLSPGYYHVSVMWKGVLREALWLRKF